MQAAIDASCGAVEPATHSCCRRCVYDLPVPDKFGKHSLGFCYKGLSERRFTVVIGNIPYIFSSYANF